MPVFWRGKTCPSICQPWKRRQFPAIELVVVNLYPFRETVARPGCSLEEAIENIDIGGPTMVRAAAKNYKSVTVVTDPEDYAPLLAEMKSSGGAVAQDSVSSWLARLFPYRCLR